ncbi:MAG: molybdenum cofactor guanylyltransferase [Gammaproteobacteria bacterium]|jgi:molybdopterin-guanine dinucleotide biosynthesis protein A|nr:molybdenum cofactor guanylyltransferase [Gammaproteobacteria bacterium]
MVNKPTAVILAGGKGSRLGGVDKGLLQINGRKLIELCIDRLRPQVASIVISANRNLPIYGQFADTVVPDTTASYPCYSRGPLAGLLSVWDYLEQNGHIGSGDLLTVPCDMPLLPNDLAARFYQRRSQSHCQEKCVVVAHDGIRLQPLCAMLPWSIKSQLEAFLNTGQCKVSDWIQYSDALIADFSAEADKFVNINTQADVAMVSAKLKNHA